MSNGQIPRAKKLILGACKNNSRASTCKLQLDQGTSCKTDFLCSMLDSNIFFLIVTLTLLKRKRGHADFQTRPPIMRVHWAANCLMQWFNTLRSIDLFPLELARIADISISFRPSGASAKDVRGKKEQECYAGYNTCHKSLKQKPFVFNVLQISYIHSSHLCSHSNVPLSFPRLQNSPYFCVFK